MMELKVLMVLLTACLFSLLEEGEALNPCHYGHPHPGLYCGKGGKPCPAYYYCETLPVDANYAACCPNFCKSGHPVLDANGDLVHCGRGGTQCPDTYHCHVAPNDAWAVCCPTI